MKSFPSHRLLWIREGLTLIEVLVVVGVMGILLALLLPAVQQAREIARKTVCANNLRQIGLGVQNHEAAFRCFPPSMDTKNHPILVSWLFRILPYLENAPTYEFAIDEFRFVKDPFRHRTFQTAMGLYHCPSDPSSGSLQWTTRGKLRLVATTSYLGINGLSGLDKSGVMFADSKLPISSITDGLSNTLLCAERPPSSDFNYGWWYVGLGYDAKGTGDVTLGVRETLLDPPNSPHLTECQSIVYQFERGTASQCDALHFWSYHSQGAHMVKCDASVSFFSYQSNDLLPKIATRAGGEVISEE